MTERKRQKICTPRLCEDCDHRVPPRVLLSPHPPKARHLAGTPKNPQEPRLPRLENVAAKLVIWKGVRDSQLWLKQPNPERFQAKAFPGLDPGWTPVRVRKTRQIRIWSPVSIQSKRKRLWTFGAKRDVPDGSKNGPGSNGRSWREADRPKRSIFCLSTRRKCILNTCDAKWLSIEDGKIDNESIGYSRLSRRSRASFCARRPEDHTGTAFLDGQERAAG
ncbi:MAG: hypothetical protein JWP25_6567 [Bradyrhizobium sp.]|nr:hypothetical protein [Bradyrhizobium sp.]